MRKSASTAPHAANIDSRAVFLIIDRSPVPWGAIWSLSPGDGVGSASRVAEGCTVGVADNVTAFDRVRPDTRYGSVCGRGRAAARGGDGD